MPDETSATALETLPTPDAPEKKKRGPYSKNDQRIAADLTAASRFLKTARTDSDIRPVALAHGVDDAELDAAEELVTDAAKKWGVRLEGMSAEDTLVDETDTGLIAIKNDYLQYRQIGRSNFTADGARTALGLSGDIPDAFDTLMTHIRAAYENAKETPYTAIFTKRNYAPARLDLLIKAIDDLVDDETDQTEAEGDAMTTTKERNQAYDLMKAAMKPIKGTLKGALRGQPNLLAKLGL